MSLRGTLRHCGVAAAILNLFMVLPIVATAQDIAPIAEGPAMLADENNTIEVVDRFGPSVVAVSVAIRGKPVNPVQDIPTENIPPALRGFVPFLEEQESVRQSSGSGFLIAIDGAPRLVTNFHVVQDALADDSVALVDGGRIEVVFPVDSQRSFEVRVVRVNPSFDLALLELVDPAYPPAAIPLSVTSRTVAWFFLEQLRFAFMPVFHGVQGRLATQG